jgi:hypothetical protein
MMRIARRAGPCSTMLLIALARGAGLWGWCASRLPLIGYSGRLRGHARKIVANQIDLICVPQLTSAKGRLAAQNGGSRLPWDRSA